MQTAFATDFCREGVMLKLNYIPQRTFKVRRDIGVEGRSPHAFFRLFLVRTRNGYIRHLIRLGVKYYAPSHLLPLEKALGKRRFDIYLYP